LGCAAGRASLRLADAEAYRRLDAAATTVGQLTSQALTEAEVPHRLSTAGNLFSIFFTDADVRDYVAASQQDTGAFAAFFHAMLDQGVYLPPRAYEAWIISTALDDEAMNIIAAALPAAARAAAAGGAQWPRPSFTCSGTARSTTRAGSCTAACPATD